MYNTYMLIKNKELNNMEIAVVTTSVPMTPEIEKLVLAKSPSLAPSPV